MSFSLGASFSSPLLLAAIRERCVYLELNSQNKNNKDQIKHKYKLCLSDEQISRIIGGKIFCSSCSEHEYLQKGKDHVLVTKNDYEECLSATLKQSNSIYIPRYVEYLTNEFLSAKKRDNMFKYKAKIKLEKFTQIRKVVRRKIYNPDYVKNESIVQVRKIIGLEPDISVLDKYGVKIDKTLLLSDW